MILEDNEKELRSAQQKSILDEVVTRLSQEETDLYYMSTSHIAQYIFELMKEGKSGLSREKLDLVQDLSSRDIEILIAS